jgi:UDP-glucose 4-epimerase
MSDSARPRALVTGVAGFLGSHLAERLLEKGHEVVGVDAFTPYYDRAQKEANLEGLLDAPGFGFLELDVSRDNLDPVLDSVSWVFHQAAQPGVRASWDEGFVDYTTHNVLGTQRVLEAARRARVMRFVYASSSSVYGPIPEGTVGEDAPRRPLSPYGVTKLAAEELVGVYHRAFELPTVSLRYFTVCGPRQRPDMAFHRMLRAIYGGRPFPRYGDGKQMRDFTYVGDAVEANLLAAERGKPGAVYNIGGGDPVALGETMAFLESVTGRTLPVVEHPRAAGDPLRTAAALARAGEDLGYRPAVSWQEALRQEADWFVGPRGPLMRSGERAS